jgi:internalin A
MDDFCALPVDLFACICTFLFAHEHVTLWHVSRALRELAKDPRSWQTVRWHYSQETHRTFFQQQPLPYVRRLQWPPRTELQPQHLHNLLQLHHLELSFVRILPAHQLPSSLSIRSLQLSDTFLRHPDVFFLEPQPSVESLTVVYADLLRIHFLPAFPSLRDLDLRHNRKLRDVSPLTVLTALKTLNLTATGITDAAVLSQLPSLTYLYLGHTPIETIDFVRDLTALCHLNLDSTDELYDLRPLSALVNLQSLSLGLTRLFDTRSLSTLQQLRTLDFRFGFIKDVSNLTSLTALQQLNLDYTKVQDVSTLSALTCLQELHLTYCHVRDLSPLSVLTSLRRLHLPGVPADSTVLSPSVTIYE